MKHYDSGIKQDTMTITYKDGSQIIHHPTGIVQELNDKDLATQKVQLEVQKTELEASIADISQNITNAKATKLDVVEVIKEVVSK